MFPLQQYSNGLIDLCRVNHVKELAVFGSALTSSFNSESDVDLVVEFDRLDPFSYAESYFNLKFAMEDLFKRRVDLLEAKVMHNPYLLQEI